MATFMQNLVNAVLTRYKTNILNILTTWFFNEDIKGYSCKQHHISQYLLTVLLIDEIKKDYDYGTMLWDDIKTKWDLDNKRKILASYGISLNLLLTDMNLPTI